ncbi:hypothetical protein R3P38DRAFT_3196074 [Favolaschia claudopus]|uniref:Uncharacterized protein n=1 Tax=Favolaschia claudopus TaxID=2862362 RepID=A0AAW0BAK9_9AGAR
MKRWLHETPSWLSIPFFDPVIRVWNVRILIILSSGTIWVMFHPDSDVPSVHARQDSIPAQIILAGLILLHHLFILLPSSWTISALFDLYWVFWEIGLVQLLLLIISTSCRIATIFKSKESLLKQRFDFFGGCTPVHPPYTPLRILIGRAMARPLLRGEATYIILFRAILIFLISLAVPAFAVYFIIIGPSKALIYTRDISLIGPDAPGASGPSGPVSMIFSAATTAYWQNTNFTTTIFIPPNGMNVTKTTGVEFSPAFIQSPCASNYTRKLGPPRSPDGSILADCPSNQWNTTLSIAIAVEIPQNRAVLVSLFQADSTPVVAGNFKGVLLLPNSHLVGAYTWTRRDVISQPTWGPSSHIHTTFTADIHSLQPDPNPPNSFSATLILHQQSPDAQQFLQDERDTTAITGISTFGGFWAFVNSTFGLLFGANVLYFMFGRRPMSALGIVHVFQRRALVRQWHEDFPAIRTEGGLPGSKSAGIVAFIRDRLVDLEEYPRPLTVSQGKTAEARDIESQSVETREDETIQEDVEGIAEARPQSAVASETKEVFDQVSLLDVHSERGNG